MRALVPVALLLALAGCKPAEQPKPQAPAKAQAAEWVFGMGKNSVELAHLVGGKASDPDLRLICARGEGFTLLAPKVAAIESEERLSLGAGGRVTALVATGEGRGVRATGAIDNELLDLLAVGEPLSLSYGAAKSGPFAPPPAVRRAFAETCRKLRIDGQV